MELLTHLASWHVTLSHNILWVCCREERLPKGMVCNGNVQKDSVFTFTRANGGRVIASADGTELATGAVFGPGFRCDS